MAQTQTINTPQDYVNYTFNIEARGIAEVSSELIGLSNTVGNILGQIAFKTSEFLSHTDMLAIGTGAAISAMFVSATQDAIHFQQQIANVQAIGGEAINANDIGNAAMEFSNKFGMATASMTEGLEALARAGITSTSVMKEVLAEGVKLSKLEGLDLEDSINDLISTTNLLSQEGVDMNDPNYGQMVQAMNQHIVSTSESAPINAQNIIQSLQHVGGYASASGMDQDDLFAVIAQLGSRGTKGEMAGTALRAFIAAGQKDTAQRALARIGLNVSDLWNNDGETMLSISEMKDVLDNALEARGYSKQEKLEFYSDFAGYKQANQIMKIDTSEVQQYKESIANAWDLGKKLDVILGTVRGNLDRIWQTTQNFMTKVGSNLLNVMSAILTPVRIFLDIITKIPFADKAVAAGMIFVAFRTGLMIFNKLVPAIAGFMSGISDASNETRGFRSEWAKTREEIEKTKDIIFLLKNKDQEGLAKKHYEEHGLSAKNKAAAERDIAGEMYMGSQLYELTGRTPWHELPEYTQDMYLERIKGTSQFKQNYNKLVEDTRNMVNIGVQEPIIIEDFSGEGTLEAINTWVELIFNLLNSDRTRGRSDHSQDNDDEGSQDNRRRNAQARTLSSIFENRVRGNTYGNVNFKYERSEEGYAEAKAGLKQAYKDLREYTRALSNTDVNNINNIQKNAYKKLFTQVSDRGIEATKTANESEIRLVLEQGKLETHENDYEGIKDAQVRYIAEKLGLDDFKFYDSQQGDRRAEFAQAAYNALKDKDANIREGIINELVNADGGTNEIWEDSLRDIARGRRDLLTRNPEIANKIISQISNINTQGYENNTDAVLGYFSGLDENHEDWNIAIKSAMEVLKGDSDYSRIEENTIKYIADNIARHKETILSYQADAETLGFSEGVRNEIEDVLNDMRNDEALLRQGGSLLGEAIVSGFIGDGLGRHSPGYMFWALVDEQTDINKAILQSRGLLNKNAGLLGLEMTDTFSSNLGFDRVFDSGIEYLRRDSDVIKDIIDNFDRDEFRTDDEQDLEYDLLPMQIDAQDGMYAIPKVMQDFVQPYGFDVSNYQRFGTNFGTSIDSITQFESILWFTQTHSEFDLDKMFDSGLFDEDDIYDYLDLLTEAFHEEKTWSYFKLKKDHDIDPSTFDSMNKFIEDYYFSFLATMSQEMSKTIINAPGLYDNVRLYRGGRLPVGSEGLGEYLGTTSTSYTKRIADIYTRMNSAVNHSANIYAPEGTLGVYLNRQQFGDRRTFAGTSIGRVFDNQIEYALGSGQPFIELPNEATGQLSGNLLRNEGDVLLLDPGQITDVQQVIVDEISDMLNSGRTDSHILNLSGIKAVNALQNPELFDDGVLMDKGPVLNTDTVNNQEQSDHLWGHGAHESKTGMLFDAAYYINKTQNKNVAAPEDFFGLIESVNGKQAAKDAEDFLNTYYSDAIKETNGKIKLPGLMNLISKKNEPFKDTRRYLKSFDMTSDVSVQQAFDLMKQHPELEDEITNILMDFIPSRRGGKFSRKFFEDNNLMNETLSIPYEYVWLLGSQVANASRDRLRKPHNSFVHDSGGKPQTSLKEAENLWEQFGPEALLNPDFRYHYNDDLAPTVDNSFERMMLGLVFSTLDDKALPYGSRHRKGGMHLYKDNTKDNGALQTLGTLIHEFTHMATQQDYRSSLPSDDKMHLPSITTSKKISGYDSDFFEEFETNFITNAIFGSVGLDKIKLAEEREKEFYKVIKQAGHTGNLQWELYDEWIKNISENIDKFIDIGEAFDRKYSSLSPDEISQKWDEVRALVNVNNNAQEFAMPATINSPEYMDYINKEREKQEEAKKATQGIAAGYKEWYKEQIKELEKLHELRTENERAQVGRIRYQQEQAQLEADGKRNAAENRKKLRERYEKQREPYEKERERKRKEEEERKKEKEKREKFLKDRRGSIKDSWDDKRKKIAESLGGGYYYFGGEKKQRDQNAAQKFLQKWAFAGADLAEKAETTLYDKSSTLRKSGQEYAKENGYNDTLNKASDKMGNLMKITEEFKGGLESLSEIFPVLTPAVFALNTALAIQEGVATALTFATEILTFSQTGETGSAFLQTMANWLVSESAVQAAIAETVLAGAIWTTNMAMKGIQLILENPIILVAIAAIIAAIEAVKFWENQHAKALEETRKELEENTARNNIALSQYKDLKKARENETDAIKKQKAARKEAIALYELEASRVRKMKSVNEESKLRNDAVWGEYGERARLQKMGWLESIFAEGIPFLGTIGKWQAGEFESQYEKYEGTTANIRQIKENTLGKAYLQNSPEARYVANVYDKNSMFFGQVEAYKEPLQELYDKESSLIERYGSIDAARGSKEFADAVKEFSDATGINGKTAGMMLDWLETENRVSQATKIGQAEIGMIQARTQAKVMAIDAEGEYGLGDMNNLGDAMIVAQFQEMMNTAKTEMWWDLLFAYMNLILSALSPWDWFTGETAKNQKKVQAYQEGLNELDAQGNQILQDMLDNQAEREDYGNEGASFYDDTSFGAALQNAGMVPQQQNLNTPNLSIDASTTSPEVYDNFQQSVNEPAKVNTPNMNKPVNTNNQNITPDKVSQTVVHIHNVNINTEDDPEKIKSALMHLIIEMQEQVVPRTVSRTIGQAPNQTSQTTDMTQNPNDSPQAEGTDQNNANNNNQNPTI